MSWKIKDGAYPYVDGVDVATSDRFKEPVPTYAWNIIDGGYGFLTTHHTAEGFELSEPYPKWVWKSVVDASSLLYSTDYPVLQYEREYTLTPVSQPPYICVFDMQTKQEDFESNGLRILSPTACKITQELNGQYELVLEHPMDDEGAWEQIIELNIIKAEGQLFTIYRVVHSYTGSVGKVTAYARHVFYQLADWWIYEAKIESPDGQHAIEQILDAMETHSHPDYTEYHYSGTSDIETPFNAELSEITPVAALIGTDSNSLLNQLGGELFRDNFRFSINQKIEGAAENAFNIRVGLNLIGIERDVDYTDFCTRFRASDNFGNAWAIGYVPNAKYAHNVVRSKMFKYEEPNFDQLIKDGQAYFDEHCEPKISYKIKIKDLKNNPDYKMFENISRYKVGDWGIIYDNRLGISTYQKVIRTVTDCITGEVTEITFGNLERSLTRPVNRQNSIATASDKFILKQQKNAELKTIKTFADLKAYTWAEIKKFTWGELSRK